MRIYIHTSTAHPSSANVNRSLIGMPYVYGRYTSFLSLSKIQTVKTTRILESEKRKQDRSNIWMNKKTMTKFDSPNRCLIFLQE